MAIKTSGDIQKQIEVILSKRSTKLVKQYAKAMYDNLQTDAQTWQRTIRDFLSSPVIGTFGQADYEPNMTLWPKRNKGRLYKDILEPKITQKYHTKSTNLRRNQIMFTISNFYGPRVKTVGRDLDTMTYNNPNFPKYGRKKSFAGWLHRSSLEWELLMIKRRHAKINIGRY